MGIFDYIKTKKDEFAQERSITKANKLAALRTNRVKLEGRAKIDRAYDEEKDKIKAAKREQFQRSFTGKAIANLKEFQKKSQARSKAIGNAGQGKNEINPAFKSKPVKKSIFD